MTNATAALVSPGELVRVRRTDPALPSITARVQAVSDVGLRLAVERTWDDWHAGNRAAHASEDRHRPTCARARSAARGRTLGRLYATDSWAERAAIAGVGPTGAVKVLTWTEIASIDVVAATESPVFTE